MQDSGSLAVFKVTATDQGHNKGPSGAFFAHCNISCFYQSQEFVIVFNGYLDLSANIFLGDMVLV